MRAVVFHQIGQWSIEDVPDPTPAPNEVVVQTKACGLCGTDLHLLKGEYNPQYPVTPGHEYAGVVVEVGRAVRSIRPGDRVAIDPNAFCGACRYCRMAKPNFCENWFGYGVVRPGGFGEMSAVIENNVIPLPEGLSFERAAMVEPVSCCLHGIDLAGIRPGDKVVVIGAGGIGQILAQLARCAGAAMVIVSDPIGAKRDLAASLGADLVVNPATQDITDAALSATGIGADVVLEAGGTRSSVLDALGVARKGGTVMWFSVCDSDLEVPVRPYDLFLREVTIRTSLTNPFTCSRALDILASGRVEIGPLITHRFVLDEFGECMASMREGRSIKAQVQYA